MDEREEPNIGMACGSLMKAGTIKHYQDDCVPHIGLFFEALSSVHVAVTSPPPPHPPTSVRSSNQSQLLNRNVPQPIRSVAESRRGWRHMPVVGFMDEVVGLGS